MYRLCSLYDNRLLIHDTTSLLVRADIWCRLSGEHRVHLSYMLIVEVIVRQASQVVPRLAGSDQLPLHCLMTRKIRMILRLLHVVCREKGCSGELAIGRNFGAIL